MFFFIFLKSPRLTSQSGEGFINYLKFFFMSSCLLKMKKQTGITRFGIIPSYNTSFYE